MSLTMRISMLKSTFGRQLERGTGMKKHQVILSTVSLVLLLGVLTPQFAQDTSTRRANADQARHWEAIGLLRTINTAEVVEHTTYGSYAS